MNTCQIHTLDYLTPKPHHSRGVVWFFFRLKHRAEEHHVLGTAASGGGGIGNLDHKSL